MEIIEDLAAKDERDQVGWNPNKIFTKKLGGHDTGSDECHKIDTRCRVLTRHLDFQPNFSPTDMPL